MILYGSKGTHLATEPVPGLRCPSCGQPNTLDASVYGRYGHIYYIPFFPVGKVGLLSCQHCQGAWEEKNLPPDLKAPVQALRARTSHKRWEWAGLAVVALLLAFGIAASARHSKEADDWLLKPRAGDIYTVRSDSTRRYTLLKVQQANGNTVEVVPNEYETDSNRPIDKINSPEKYSHESYTLTLLDLQGMRKKGQLTDVERAE